MPLLREEKINTQPPKGKQNLKVVGRMPRKNTFHLTNGDGAQQGTTYLFCKYSVMGSQPLSLT